MRKTIRYIQILLLVLVVSLAFVSKAQISNTQWREHLPYRKAIALETSDDYVFCLTESGLFQYGLKDNGISTYSKTKGLSDSEISAIAWDKQNTCLIIAYANGNIDLLKENQVVNIPDVKNHSSISKKGINQVLVSGSKSYLATDFGIVVVNVAKAEIADTYFIGKQAQKIKVNQIQIEADQIYAATDQGIYQADVNSTNLADFNNWSQIQSIPNATKACQNLLAINNKLFVSRLLDDDKSELLYFDDFTWKTIRQNTSKIYSFRLIENQIYLVQDQKIERFNANASQVGQVNVSGNRSFRDIIQSNSRLFIADYNKSMLEFTENKTVVIKPDGPRDHDLKNIYSFSSDVWAVPHAFDNNYQALQKQGLFYQFRNQIWKDFSSESISELRDVKDIHCLSNNKNDASLLYAGSWGNGLFVLEDLKYQKHWNALNSPLGTKGIGDLHSDSDGNLWVLDANSNAPVKVLTPENKWISLHYSPLKNRNDLLKIQCLQNGDKWVLRSLGDPVFAFNENGSVENEDDDAFMSFHIRDENKNPIGNVVYDFVEDQNQQLWVGTEKGVAVYTNPGTIFREGEFYAYRPIITINESTQYLLASEKVLSIAVDGANKKWLGTKNSGVYYVSEDGEEQLKHFTKDNSPLPSNTIEKISVNPKTGDVFFLTDKGLISYQNKVTEGEETYGKLYVYPNPVRETYRGDIVVSGLVSNSIVKITDVSGNLVWEGKSKGGQYIWNGRNFNGSRVHTGVYLIFCATEDGGKSEVIKLLFIN
jgi:ligand-binding sensor domain-containing protein